MQGSGNAPVRYRETGRINSPLDEQRRHKPIAVSDEIFTGLGRETAQSRRPCPDALIVLGHQTPARAIVALQKRP